MKMHKLFCRAVSLLLTATLLLSACGSPADTVGTANDAAGTANAATMHLRSLVGDVGVADGDGKDLDAQKGMGLYSNYALDTQNESFAWIDLDEVKLVKLDEDSAITILKKDKLLTIEVGSGSIFFHVAEPLAEDEEMSIRSSTMMVGIRGTCGWVEIPEPGMMNVYLLEGTVECSVTGKTTTATAGEVACLNETDGTITVAPFGKVSIPGFVTPELDHIGLPLDDIPETASSADASEPEGSEPESDDPVAAAEAAYREILANPEACDFHYEEAYMDPIVASGVYRYALMWMDSYHEAPALLLMQEGTDGFNLVEVFQYFSMMGQANSHGIIPEGINPKVKRHTSLYVPQERYGIIYEEVFESRPDDITAWRYSLSSGGSEDNPNFGLGRGSTLGDPGRGEIIWYDTTDLTGIDNMTELAQGPQQ